MTVRFLGTVGLLSRNCASNRSGLLRCCSINYEKLYPTENQQYRKFPINIISRDLSFDSLTQFPTLIFRYIAESEVSAYTRDVFTYVHDTTGLPWWGTIVLSGVALKVYSIPFRIYQLVLLGRLEKIKNMSEIAKKVQELTIKKQKANMWTPERAKSAFRAQMRRERKYLIEKHNCHPFKVILLGYFELPVWLCASITWRTMSYGFSDNITSSNILTAQMLTEGTFWCTNLTSPDPTYILPALVLLSQMANVELGVIQSNLLKKEKTWVYRILTNLSRLFGLIAAIFCSYLPAAVSLFWVSSTGLNLVRDFILISPTVRRVLNLPYEPVTQKEVLAGFKEKILKLVRLKGKNSKSLIKDK